MKKIRDFIEYIINRKENENELIKLERDLNHERSDHAKTKLKLEELKLAEETKNKYLETIKEQRKEIRKLKKEIKELKGSDK